MRIGIHVFDDAEELDWVGPWEVLAAWAHQFPDDDVEVFTVARADRHVRCAKGLRITADYTWQTAPHMDVVIYPGGWGTRAHLGDEQIRRWVRDLAAARVLVTSVCTGSLVLADADLLDGRPATTHWTSVEQLSQLGRDIEVRPNDRFVDAGDVITAAGVSAGIDMALYLVVRLHSAERARQVRRNIQYDPAPPI